MLHSLRHIAFALLFASVSLAQNALTLSPPATASGNISAALDPSFAGFGIETSNLFSFTGADDANDFSIQLLQNLADYSGAPPHLRIGGNTGDYMIFDASYKAFDLERNARSTGPGAIASDANIFGPSMFQAIDRFPTDTPITYGLNLAYEASDFTSKIVAEAQAALDGLKNVKLVSFEIGNEPDLYLKNGFRTGAWDGKTYVQQVLSRAAAVHDQVLQPAGLPSTFFEGPATASTIGTTFELKELIQNGLMATTNGSNFISAWNEHDYFYFIGVSPYAITLDILMNMDNTSTQFAYWEQQVAIGLDAGLPFALREMSSVGPIGLNGVSDTFGASLWTLNFLLYTASLNISSVQMHMTENSNASAWQPIDMYGNGPHVRPQYYAHAAVAQIIGNGNGTTQVSSIDLGNVPSGYTGRIRAYAAYAHGNLQAVVLLNTKPANASDSSSSVTINLNLGSGFSKRTLHLSYLTAGGSDSLSGTTWNGISFESNADGTAKVVDDSQKTAQTSSSGSVSVTLRDSQAVVANLDWLLGSNPVLRANGSTTKPTHHKSGAARLAPMASSLWYLAVWAAAAAGLGCLVG